MMHSVLLGQTGVLLIRSVAPFTLADIRQSHRDRAAERIPGMTLATPIIFDGRSAPLLDVDTGGLGELLLERKFLQRGTEAGPFVSVVHALQDHGLWRLFNVLSHVSKVRDESKVHISDSMAGGLSWMADALAPDGPSVDELTGAVARVYEKPPARRLDPVSDEEGAR